MQCIIVDDEPQARKLLQTYITSISGFTVTRLCSSAIEAYEALSTGTVDLMFLDIKMPVISGIDFLRSLKNPPLVIFTTAYHQYAVEGYELDVLDYLVKPINMSRLIKALDKAKQRLNEKTITPAIAPGHIFIKHESRLVKVMLNNIEYIEGMQNYVKIILKDKSTLITGSTMIAMEDMLPANEFIRVHRSFIVPLSAIASIGASTVETATRQIPIGQSYRDNILKLAGRG